MILDIVTPQIYPNVRVKLYVAVAVATSLSSNGAIIAGSKTLILDPSPIAATNWNSTYATCEVPASRSVHRPKATDVKAKENACSGLYFPNVARRAPATTAKTRVPMAKGRKSVAERRGVVVLTAWK